jgi:hypothetical protein
VGQVGQPRSAGSSIEDRTAWTIAIALGLIGLALLAGYPFAKRRAAREHADIARAFDFLLVVPLADLQQNGGRHFEVRIPDDDQWIRIGKRLGPPKYILAPAGDTKFRSQVLSASAIGLRARVARRGEYLTLQTTRQSAVAYHGDLTGAEGFELSANPGDALTIEASVDAEHIPADAVLLLAPNWDRLSVDVWADGAAAGDILLPLAGIVAGMVGIALLYCATLIAFGRPGFNSAL